MADNYLVHHGILGQKWGIRRYQNADGTLTAEGKKRYADDLADEYKTLTGKNIQQHSGKRKLRDVSDDELRSIVNRLNLEKQYREAIDSQVGRAAAKEGRAFAKDIGKTIAKQVLTGVGTQVGISILGTGLNFAGGRIKNTPFGTKIGFNGQFVNIKQAQETAQGKKKKKNSGNANSSFDEALMQLYQ